MGVGGDHRAERERGQGARSDVGRGAEAVPALLLAKPVPALGRRHSVRREPMVKEASRQSSKAKHVTCRPADVSIVRRVRH